MPEPLPPPDPAGPPAMPPVKPPLGDAVAAAEALDAWVVDRLHNTAVSRDTARFNRVLAGVAGIKSILAELME